MLYTNDIDIEAFRLQFKAIYIKHSPYWAELSLKHPDLQNSAHVTLMDQYTGNLDFDAFSHYIGTIARTTPVIPYTVTSAIVLDDGVSGCHAYLLMDLFAKAKLDVVHQKLFSGSLSDDMYLERSTFVAGTSLGWLKTWEEATRIVDEINSLPIHITGQIDSLILTETAARTPQSRVFKLGTM
jgi:hypothetical protein